MQQTVPEGTRGHSAQHPAGTRLSGRMATSLEVKGQTDKAGLEKQVTAGGAEEQAMPRRGEGAFPA